MPVEHTARCFLFEPLFKNKNAMGSITERGIPTYLFNGDRPSTFDTERVCDEIRSRLKDHGFNPDVDYIVVGGGINAVTQLIAVACIDYGVVKALLYSLENDCYVEREVG